MARFLSEVAEAPFLALDTETSGLDPHLDTLLLIQFGTGQAQCLVDAQAVDAAALAPIFRPDRPVVMHNASFDLKMLEKNYGPALGLAEARVVDTLQNEKLLRAGRKSMAVVQSNGLKALAERYAGMELDKSVREGFFGIQTADDLSPAELHYAARDVEATYKVLAEQLPALKRDGLMRAAGIEGAAGIAFAELELNGAPIDKEAWAAQIEAARKGGNEARGRLDREFWDVADRDLFGGTTLNYSDDEEVRAALGRLGVELPNLRREVLIASGHPAALELARFREHHKIVSSYGDTFMSFVHKRTGRIHPRFRAIGASTGRASCAEPNLQNIPSGSVFRACFRAPEGRRLITADYQGAELRIIAEVSEDPVFIRTLAEGGDLHSIVASRLFGVEVSKTERPELRARAKAINFGLVYGMGPGGLARQLGVEQPEAERLLAQYFRAFPRIRGYLEEAAQAALSRGYAETLSGRRFWFLDMRREQKDTGSMERVAKNMPIQGTNADITKLAMARFVAAAAAEGLDAFLVNMVHDEIVVEAAEAQAEQAEAVLVREMIAAGAELIRRVPMSVDSKVDQSWSK